MLVKRSEALRELAIAVSNHDDIAEEASALALETFAEACVDDEGASVETSCCD